MKYRPFFFLFVSFLFFIAGCSHGLRITNMDEYFNHPTAFLKTPLKIGVTSGADGHIQNSRYITAIVDAIQRNGNIEKVIHPFSAAVHQDAVDVVVDISVNPRYSGRGSNFFVNWPGFLIWAPAIWGYGYVAEIDTVVNINRLKEGASQQVTIPTKYYFRQAEMDRTWTEIGWLEVSLIPLIGGIVFTQYDPDVTDEFISKVSPNYGPFVANKIIAAF